jgi:hypothetical protein
MNIIIPPALHSRRVTLELTTRLCSKDHLLQGINDIMKFEHSEDCKLQCYGRKVLSLLLNILYNQLTTCFCVDHLLDRGKYYFNHRKLTSS